MSRESDIALEASKRIYRTEYVWAKRLRYTREVLQGLQRRFSTGPLSDEDMQQITYIWKLHTFAEAVRAESNRLIADPSKTMADANWPVFETFTPPPTPSVWTDGIAQSAVQGLTDDLAEVWEAIEAEEQERTQKDQAHDTAIASLQTGLASETTARQSADNSFQTQISGMSSFPGYGSSASALAATQSPGAATTVSRSDHVHPRPTPSDIGAATAAQGAKADSALQNAGAFATAAQGVKADSALQNITSLIAQGTGITITGNGTAASPYLINNSIGATRVGGGSASTSAVLIAGGSVDLTVPLSYTFPNTAYLAFPVLTNSSATVLGNLAATVKTKNTNSVVVTLKNNGLAAVALGQVVEVIAYSP